MGCHQILVRTTILGILLGAVAGGQSPTPPATNPPADAAEESTPGKPSPEKEPTPEADKPPETFKAQGYFAAVQDFPVELRPEEFQSFEVKSAVAHGTPIIAGDVLIEFVPTEYDQVISDLEQELTAGELELQLAERQMELTRKTMQLELADAERAERIATENLKHYLAWQQARDLRDAKFSLKRSKDYHAYQSEELKQLLKMYEADDLTEETEEIILQRTRDEVEASEYYLEGNEHATEFKLQYELPRKAEATQRELTQAVTNLERLRLQQPAQLQKEELELEGKHRKLDRLKKRRDDLRKDAQWLVVRAPATGHVYYGTHKRGAWQDPHQLDDMLSAGGICKVRTVLMTIVPDGPVRILASVKENQIRHLKVGTKILITPDAYPESTLPGTVASIGRFPVAAGSFECSFTLDTPTELPLVPGMACEIKLPETSP